MDTASLAFERPRVSGSCSQSRLSIRVTSGPFTNATVEPNTDQPNETLWGPDLRVSQSGFACTARLGGHWSEGGGWSVLEPAVTQPPAPHLPSLPGPPSLPASSSATQEPACARDVAVPPLDSSAVPSLLHLSPPCRLISCGCSHGHVPLPVPEATAKLWAGLLRLGPEGAPVPGLSPGSWRFPQACGLWPADRSPGLCLCPHMGFSWVSLGLFSYLRTLVIGFRAPLTQDDLIETSFTLKTSAKTLIPNRATF